MSRTLGTYKYFAFISYKREDVLFAKKLQKSIEEFHLPISLRENNPDLPERIRPLFRDDTELSSGRLSESLNRALSESRFLIVICSPASSQSQWVNKEVSSFIQAGREEDIVPVIIGGKPFSGGENECFPESLLNLPKERELLGIDVRSGGWETAVIKIIARMLNLDFDILWQRHKRSQKKRRIILSITISLAVVILTGLGLVIGKRLVPETQETGFMFPVNLDDNNGTAFIIWNSLFKKNNKNELSMVGNHVSCDIELMIHDATEEPQLKGHIHLRKIIAKGFAKSGTIIHFPKSERIEWKDVHEYKDIVVFEGDALLDSLDEIGVGRNSLVSQKENGYRFYAVPDTVRLGLQTFEVTYDVEPFTVDGYQYGGLTDLVAKFALYGLLPDNYLLLGRQYTFHLGMDLGNVYKRITFLPDEEFPVIVNVDELDLW